MFMHIIHCGAKKNMSKYRKEVVSICVVCTDLYVWRYFNTAEKSICTITEGVWLVYSRDFQKALFGCFNLRCKRKLEVGNVFNVDFFFFQIFKDFCLLTIFPVGRPMFKMVSSGISPIFSPKLWRAPNASLPVSFNVLICNSEVEESGTFLLWEMSAHWNQDYHRTNLLGSLSMPALTIVMSAGSLCYLS